MPEPEQRPASLHLQDHHMDQFGIKKLPKVGDKIPLKKMHGRVTSVADHGEDGGRSISMELEQMAEKATQRASEEDVQEGKLKGAKAAMDQALDAEEMSRKQNAKHGKAVGRKP
jgi:hypothetical protein